MNDWLTVSIVAVAGLILGALFVYFNRRRNTTAIAFDVERKDLKAKRDALVQQLRDTSLSEDERTRLELETAEAMRKLDEHTPAASSTAAAAPMAMNPSIKGFLWGAASVAALAGLAWFVMEQMKPREQNGVMTGGFESSAQQPQQAASAPASPMVQQLEAAVQAQPNNIELRNDLAQAYLESDNLMAVFQQTKLVLDQAPEDSRALTLQALVRMAMGETTDATNMLLRATKSEPKNLDAWVSLAWIHAQSDRMDEAEKMIAEAKRQSPEEHERLDAVFAQIKQQIAQGGAQQAQTLPADHPPITPDGAPMQVPMQASAPVSPSAPSGPGVHVTLDLDASAKTRSGIVFVIARNPAGGPPVAVKRIVAGTFPVDVELTSADSMMGQQLPATFRLEARLDTDGDPMTRPATDPAAMQENVAPGANVRLALK